MVKICDICGRKIEHEKDLEICEKCLRNGYKVLKRVLSDLKSEKKNRER